MILKIKKQLFEVDKRKNLILTKTKGARWREEGERGGEREEEREREENERRNCSITEHSAENRLKTTPNGNAHLLCASLV